MKGMQKISRGRGFKGALGYALGRDADHKHEPGIIIGGNCGTDEKNALATLVRAASLRKDIQKPVWHNALRLPAGEHIEPEKLSAIADAYMVKMGFTDAHPRIYVMHDDIDGQHVHIIASRVSLMGEVYLGQNENLASTRHIQDLELEHGLMITKGPEYRDEKLVMPARSALKKGEIEMAIETGAEPTRQRLQRLIDAAAVDRPTTSRFLERLTIAGVGIKTNVASTGRMNGFSYELDGVAFKASDLGKAYGWKQFERTIDYEQNRDGEALRRYSAAARDRAAFEQPTDAHDRTDRTVGAISASDGGPDRRDAEDTIDNQRRGAIESAVAGQFNESGRRVMEGSGSGSAEDHQPSSGVTDSDSRSAAQLKHEIGMVGIFRRSDYSSPVDRIISLAETARAGASSDARSAGNRASAGAILDRTSKAVQAQIAAFDCPSYDIGIRNEATGMMQNKRYTHVQLVDAIPYLKRQNARGEHIYIRPGGEHSFVLLDDVKKSTIEQMKADGYEPSITVETSPDNFQAWLKLSPEPLPAEVRQEAAKALAKHYGADTGSADAKHYGRLVGFTNPKPKYQINGRQPFVLLHENVKRVAKAAKALLDKIAVMLEKRQKLVEIARVPDAPARAKERHITEDPAVIYRRIAKDIMQQYPDTDMSRLDFMASKELVRLGHSHEAIVKAIKTASPAIDERKKSSDYAERTATAAGAVPLSPAEVAAIAARKAELEAQAAMRNAALQAKREAEQNRGHDMEM